MQAAAIVCINYITKDETIDILGDAIRPIEGELAAILRAIRTNSDTARKSLIFTDSKEAVPKCQTHLTSNKTAQAVKRKSKELGAQYGIEVEIS